MDTKTLLEFFENNVKSLKESATRTVEHAAIASAQDATVAQALRNMESHLEQIKSSLDTEPKITQYPPKPDDESPSC